MMFGLRQGFPSSLLRNVEGLEWGFEVVLEAELWMSNLALALCKFTEEKHLGDVLIIRVQDMPSPSRLCLLKGGVNTGHIGMGIDLCVRHLILLSDFQQPAETSCTFCMEVEL